MGVDYNILISKGLLIRDLSKLAYIPDDSALLEHCIFDDRDELFITAQPPKNYYAGACDTEGDAIDKILDIFDADESDAEYLKKIEDVTDEIITHYQDHRDPINVQFCRTFDHNLVVGSFLFRKYTDQTKEFVDTLCANPAIDRALVEELVTQGVIGDVMVQYYS